MRTENEYGIEIGHIIISAMEKSEADLGVGAWEEGLFYVRGQGEGSLIRCQWSTPLSWQPCRTVFQAADRARAKAQRQERTCGFEAQKELSWRGEKTETESRTRSF